MTPAQIEGLQRLQLLNQQLHAVPPQVRGSMMGMSDLQINQFLAAQRNLSN